MKKKLMIVFSIILIIAIGIITFIFFNNMNSSNTKNKTETAEKVFNDFSKGLNDLDIEYVEANIDVSDYNVAIARMYISGDSRVAIYYLDVDDKEYEKIKNDGYITSNSNKDLIVSGMVENGYLFYLEQNFPKNTEVYELFSSIVNK